MRQVISPPHRLEGEVHPPGDKSISHRAILLNAIARGNAHVSNFCAGDDRTSMLRCLRALGVRIKVHTPCPDGHGEECFAVHGRGPEGLSEPATVMNAGNSGTTMRLVSGLLAARPFFSVITGDRSLRKRPMNRIVEPLAEMGAKVMGRSDESLAPLAFRGGDLRGIDYSLPVASAQVKSCILIAGLSARGKTTIRQTAASRDHTERLITAMGADMKVDGSIYPFTPSELASLDVRVPG